MIMKNPLENPTYLATVTRAISTNDSNASFSSFVEQNVDTVPRLDNTNRVSSQQPSSYTTQSLTTPMKGIIPKLQREESAGIPIPGRAQSHDDIRMLGTTGSGYSTPNSQYGNSPNSPREQYMYGSSPVGMNLSPPINYNANPYLSTRGGITVARRALSRATSPLSRSAPNNSYTNQAYKINVNTSNRNIAASTNCSRSDHTCPFHTKNLTHKHSIRIEHCIKPFSLLVIVAKLNRYQI